MHYLGGEKVICGIPTESFKANELIGYRGVFRAFFTRGSRMTNVLCEGCREERKGKRGRGGVLAFWELMFGGRRSGKGWAKESLEPQIPIRQGCWSPLTHGPFWQACKESRNGIIFPFSRSGNCVSEDSRDLSVVPQVGSKKVEMGTQVSWLPEKIEFHQFMDGNPENLSSTHVPFPFLYAISIQLVLKLPGSGRPQRPHGRPHQLSLPQPPSWSPHGQYVSSHMIFTSCQSSF